MKNPDRALWPLLLLVATLHLVFQFTQPTPELFGDEKYYLKYAILDAEAGERSLLPGTYRFAARPEFYSRFVSQFISDPSSTDDVPGKVALTQIVLLLGLVTMVYYQARILGQSVQASLVSAGSLAVFPWFAFHVHSLWPEILHAFFFAGLVLASLLHIGTGRPILLIAAGLLAGMAMLTKGVLNVLLPVLLVGYCSSTLWRRHSLSIETAAWRRALLAPAIFGAALFCVVGPQLIRNESREGVLGISANRWWNIEIGLTVGVDPEDPEVYSDDLRWIASKRVFKTYKSFPEREREERARQRTLIYLSESSPSSVVGRQVSKIVDLWIAAPGMIQARQATFAQALGSRHRWGDPAPVWISGLGEFARWFWRLLLPLGVAGLILMARKDRGGVLVLTLAVVFLTAALVVPLKVRLLLPVVPLLALGLGALLDRASVLLQKFSVAAKV